VVDAVRAKVEGFLPGVGVVGRLRGAFAEAEMVIPRATELLVIPVVFYAAAGIFVFEFLRDS